MGFCRRCGEIVFGPRCKCGGSAVAPVVNWSAGDTDSKQDKWSKTYVTKDKPDATNTPVQPSHTGSNNAAKRFPRPTSTSNPVSVSISSRVSAHIRQATTSRPTSPLKHSNTGSLASQDDEVNAEEGILPSPHGSELAKVYGSVLQPKETLASFTCAICATPFPPDATIYPDPSNVSASGIDTSSGQSGTRFLCRPCFTTHGGSKGDCDRCHRPVLILKSEGGFVENSGRVWHKKCFECDGCGKSIGDRPMVDLLGRPSCAECFDSCLKRPSRDDVFSSPKRTMDSPLGGNRRESKTREREGSPALEELEARLGINRNGQGTASSASPVGRSNRPSPTTPTKDSSRSWQSPSSVSDRPRTNSTSSNSFYSPTTISSGRAVERTNNATVALHDTSFEASGNPTLTRSTYSRSRMSDVVDEFGGSPTRTRSPRTSIGGTGPTEDAIEEMKRRFLSGNGSPAVPPQKLSGSNTNTPRRRSRSRSRSRPRGSLGGDTPTPTSTAGTPTPTRTLRGSASTSSLRLRYQRTGETETDLGLDMDTDAEAYRILPDRTGESTLPLRIRRTHTGGTQTTAISRDLTGSTSFLTEHRMGEMETYVKASETGETYRAERMKAQRTGDAVSTEEIGYVKKQRTGDAIARQRTSEGRVRRQRTGEMEVQISSSGASEYPEVRMQRTDEGHGHIRHQRTGEADAHVPSSRRRDHGMDVAGTDYALRRDRTGDAEVESLLGPIASLATGDLIDLSPSSEPVASLSRIPQRLGHRVPARITGDYRSSLELGFRTSTSSTSSLTSSGYESSASSVPDLASDFSDTTSTRSSGPATPPSVSPPARVSAKGSSYGPNARNITPTPRSRSKTTVGRGLGIMESDIPRDERCAKCNLPLFSIKHGGKFVTVPEEPSSTGSAPRRYHTSCFKCTVCGKIFEEKEGGHAVFVRVEEGACHVHCAPPERITLRKNTAAAIPKTSKIPIAYNSTGNVSPPTASRTAYYTSSSRYEPPPTTAPPSNTSFPPPQPRFGGSSSCPGCMKAVSPMERGVVPGPQGSKWHAGCLICGGPQAKGKRKEVGKAGCGKKLDSAAKLDAEGGVWCRECLLLLPMHLRQASPIKSPTGIVPMGTGSRPFSVVIPQGTGTTLARQFTGVGGAGSDGDLLRQLTGGGLSPTRQLSSSPTKMFDGPRAGAGRFPRPKSVIGTRSTGNGEGRGMFLVRQLTGGNSSFSGNEFGL